MSQSDRAEAPITAPPSGPTGPSGPPEPPGPAKGRSAHAGSGSGRGVTDSGSEPVGGAEIADLVAGLRAGRSEAWTQLYQLTHVPLLRLVLNQLGRSVDPGLKAQAEDVLQAVFVAAIESIERFDPQKGTVDMWLTGIAKRKVKELRRSHQRESARFTSGGDGPESADGRESSATEASRGPGGDAAGGHAEAVRVALDQLEPRYAEVLRRKYLLHQSLAEIAGALGFTVSTVGIWLYRGRDKFRQAFLRVQHGGAPAQGPRPVQPAAPVLAPPLASPDPEADAANRSLDRGGSIHREAGGSVLHWPRPGEATD